MFLLVPAYQMVIKQLCVYVGIAADDIDSCSTMLSVSLRPSNTSRYCIKTAKHRIKQIMPHDSRVTLFFGAKDLNEMRPGSCRMGSQMQVPQRQLSFLLIRTLFMSVQPVISESHKLYVNVYATHTHTRLMALCPGLPG